VRHCRSKRLPTGARRPEEQYHDIEENIYIQIIRTVICEATDINPVFKQRIHYVIADYVTIFFLFRRFWLLLLGTQCPVNCAPDNSHQTSSTRRPATRETAHPTLHNLQPQNIGLPTLRSAGERIDYHGCRDGDTKILLKNKL
jgi:hypothetical protein